MKLMVDSLIEECERFLNQPINASNCLDLMVCAHEMKRVKVEEKAVEYFTVSNCLERKKMYRVFSLTDTFCIGIFISCPSAIVNECLKLYLNNDMSCNVHKPGERI